MRMKRTMDLALCALMACALCLTVLPRGAMAASGVTIDGASLNAGTPYYRGGTTTADNPPGGWTAWFTGDALQLRNISRPADANQGISIINGGARFSLVLVGNANAYTLAGTSTESAVQGDAIVFTGSGALSVETGTDGRYGVEASNSIVLEGGASLTAAGNLGATNRCVTTPDWSRYTITADTDRSGGNADTVTPVVYQEKWATYRYVRFTAIPQPDPSVPDTGDSAPLALLVGLVLLSGAGLVVNNAWRKRRGER